MPRYRFECTKCNITVAKRVKAGVSTQLCECGNTMNWKMPNLNGSSDMYETIDKNSNTQWTSNHTEEIKLRKDEYFWRHEVPRLVNTGVYSLETMLENNWIIVNEKGKIEIQTTPPHKR